MSTPDDEDRSQPGSRTTLLGWQHFQLRLPRTWNPVRINGDFRAGEINFADGRGPTLGLRWSTPSPRRLDAEAAVRNAMRAEVGQLALAEARPCPIGSDSWLHPLLYEESAPPGRDVWCTYSEVTGRLVQLTYVADRRNAVLRDRVLPTLVDHPAGRATLWSIFDLNLVAPAEASLIGHRLNAGDLALRFDGPVGQWSVRQLGPASLAIARQPLAKWLATPPPAMGSADRPLSRFYRLDQCDPSNDSAMDAGRCVWRRRQRYFWRPGLQPVRVTLGRVDPTRDRLVMLEGSDEPLLRQIDLSVASLSSAEVR